MNDMNIICLASGLLQFGMAWYALRLGRLVKSTVAGWLLFGALTLLALFGLFLAVGPLDAGIPGGITLEIIYCLFSLLLLVGMVRSYSSLRNFLQAQGAERRALDEWESQVKERWVELNKTNAKLYQTINRLEKEIAERKQAQENLQVRLAASFQKEQALPHAATDGQTEVIERQPAQPTPEPAGQDRERPPSATPPNGEKLRAVVVGNDTEIIRHPASEPVDQSGGQPLITPGGNGGESPPAVAGRGTVAKKRKPTPNPAAESPEGRLTAPRGNPVEPWETAFISDRKTGRPKSIRTRRNKPAQAR